MLRIRLDIHEIEVRDADELDEIVNDIWEAVAKVCGYEAHEIEIAATVFGPDQPIDIKSE